jgi:hypothetical protein
MKFVFEKAFIYCFAASEGKLHAFAKNRSLGITLEFGINMGKTGSK